MMMTQSARQQGAMCKRSLLGKYSLAWALAIWLAAPVNAAAVWAQRGGDTIRTNAPTEVMMGANGTSLVTDSTAIGSDEMSAMTIPARLDHLLNSDIFDRTQVGLYVYDLTADSLLYTYHDRQCMRPASNEKIVTSIAALWLLGGSYQYETKLYATKLPTVDNDAASDADANEDYQGRVAIKAGYDPLFDASDMKVFVGALIDKGIRRIQHPIIVDLSFKDDKALGWGWCWDDDEVPLKPLLYKNKDRFVDALREAVADAGIEWDGQVEEGAVPSNAKLLVKRTHSIDQVMKPMMKKSDNSMAESLFYQIAAQGGQRYATRKHAVQHVQRLIREIGLNPDHYQIADGSGLSLYNYLTPQLLGELLRYAYRHAAIYNHLLPTLPVAGVDGTLAKRMHGSAAKGNVQAKTGTVEGVSTLSGYVTAANGHRLCFSIMNQGIRKTATGRHFQDRVCDALAQ